MHPKASLQLKRERETEASMAVLNKKKKEEDGG
jgi:hypothetical protein